MNVLVACEESQRVCISFRERGHNAFSCDIQECSGGHQEWHIKGDVLRVLNPVFFNCEFADELADYAIPFRTEDGITHCVDKWDLIIAHPPCTYLTVTGNRWFNVERYGEKALQRIERREHAAEFFMQFVYAKCEKICIENPVGYMSTAFKKPSQIIQPYYFGDHVRKATCLWLKGLDKLKPTEIVDYEVFKHGFSGPCRYVKDENGKILSYSDPRTAKERSKTFWGIARAMAAQWG